MTTALIALSVLLLVAAAEESTRFVIRYRRVTWRRTREGRHLMGFTRALATALWATLALAVLPLPLWVDLCAQVVLFAWLAFVTNQRNRIFTANQREAAAAAQRGE